MSAAPTSESETKFVCDCDWRWRIACAGSFYKEHHGKRYCVLHFPGNEKSADFLQVFERKTKKGDFQFQGAWFPDELVLLWPKLAIEINFDGATFAEKLSFIMTAFTAPISFRGATFMSDASFFGVSFVSRTDFSLAVFDQEAIFFDAKFHTRANFGSATFGGKAFFAKATFHHDVDFGNVTFTKDLDFRGATFEAAALLAEATFRDYVRFEKSFRSSASLDLAFTRVEKPEHFSFHTMTLRPHWFVNVDARRFDFNNVDWDWRNVNQEIESLQKREVSSRHRLLAIACRHLAVNAEENNRYEEASKFRYMAMDTRRREKWGGFVPWRLSWWYWLASGYGERVLQAFLVLLGIWFVAGLLYTRVGFAPSEPKLASETEVASVKRDDIGAPLKFSRALTYSAGVMTLQKPEPRPATTAAQTVVLLETVLGPVQAALLALAIRRKFMR